MLKFIINLIALYFLNIVACFCQSAISDSSYYSSAVDRLTNLYLNDTDNKSGIYNGYEHLGYYNDIKGFAYFESPEAQMGCVTYNNLNISLPILYDLVTDAVVIKHYNGYTNLSLIKEQIDQFCIGSHRFIKLDLKTSEQNIPYGFYELLKSGDSASLYAKRVKVINENIVGQKLEMQFVSSSLYFIYLRGKYYKVKSKPAVLELLGDKKKAILSYLRDNKIKFNRNMEAALVSIVQRYNEI